MAEPTPRFKAGQTVRVIVDKYLSLPKGSLCLIHEVKCGPVYRCTTKSLFASLGTLGHLEHEIEPAWKVTYGTI